MLCFVAVYTALGCHCSLACDKYDLRDFAPLQTPVRTNDLLNALHYILQPSSGPELAHAFHGMLLRRTTPAEQSLVEQHDNGVPRQDLESAEGPTPVPHAKDNAATRAETGFLAGDDYYAAKEQLITDEQILLRILCFDLNVESPHKYLLNLCRLLQCSQALNQLAVCLVRVSPPLLFEHLPHMLMNAWQLSML